MEHHAQEEADNFFLKTGDSDTNTRMKQLIGNFGTEFWTIRSNLYEKLKNTSNKI